MKKIEAINLNSYIKPNPHTLVTQTNKYITNGTDNDYFYYVEDRYLGSPTNQAIIDGVVNYVLGDGLEVVSGNVDINDIIDEEDLRNAITDFKIHGALALQVVPTVGKEKKISKLYYVPTKSIAIVKQDDMTEDIKSYWYCFDWKNKSKFKPYTIPAFGQGDGTESELLYIKRQSPQPLFALPDYQSGLQYCEMEEEMSNFTIKNIKNSFSIGKIINVNEPIEEEGEALEDVEADIKNKVTGTNNQGGILVSFNRNKENATTVDNIEVTDSYQQLEFISGESSKKIMLSHKVNDPGLFGLPMPNGFASQAEQTKESLKVLYRNQINPIRRIILKGLEKALKKNDPNIKLNFKDFVELNSSEQTTEVKELPNVPVVGKIDTFDAQTLEAQATLKGSVGGVTALLAIQEKYAQEIITYDAAISLIKQLFGFDENTAKSFLK